MSSAASLNLGQFQNGVNELKPLAAFQYSHRGNNGQQLERNALLSSIVRDKLSEQGTEPLTSSQLDTCAQQAVTMTDVMSTVFNSSSL